MCWEGGYWGGCRGPVPACQRSSCVPWLGSTRGISQHFCSRSALLVPPQVCRMFPQRRLFLSAGQVQQRCPWMQLLSSHWLCRVSPGKSKELKFLLETISLLEWGSNTACRLMGQRSSGNDKIRDRKPSWSVHGLLEPWEQSWARPVPAAASPHCPSSEGSPVSLHLPALRSQCRSWGPQHARECGEAPAHHRAVCLVKILPAPWAE